jgi:hypothetical protein
MEEHAMAVEVVHHRRLCTVLLGSSSCGERAAKERELVVERELCREKLRERIAAMERELPSEEIFFQSCGGRAAAIKACGCS